MKQKFAQGVTGIKTHELRLHPYLFPIGLPLDMEFISFDYIKDGVPEGIDVIRELRGLVLARWIALTLKKNNLIFNNPKTSIEIKDKFVTLTIAPYETEIITLED